MKKMAKAAALLAAALVLFACKNIEDGGEIRPPAPEQGSGGSGGEQKPGGNGNSGGEEGEAGDETVLYKDLADFFTKEYPAEFSGVTQSTNITLTAQTIKDVVEKTPAFETQVKAVNTEESKKKVIQDFNAIDANSKIAIMAQVAGKLNITRESNTRMGYKYNPSTKVNGGPLKFMSSDYKISVNKNNVVVSLSGPFDLDKEYIKLLSDNINVSEAEILSTGNVSGSVIGLTTETFKNLWDDLNLSNKSDISKWPKLNFAIYNGDYGLKHFLNIYEKYNESTKMQIIGNFESTTFDGSKLVDNSGNYTLFSDDNTAKESTKAKDVKSMDINTLVNFSNKYNVKDIKNIIISGNADSNNVDWTKLTNVIFEGNMSKLTINNKTDLEGIVYFKDLPYKNSNISSVIGSLKLDKMANTMDLNGDGNGQKSFVLDISGISNFYNYSGNPLIKGSRIVNAVYFNIDQKSRKGDTLYQKVADAQSGVIDNVYFDGILEDGANYNRQSGHQTTSSEARTLKEFEYFGNNGKYENDGKTVALNNKNIDFIRAEGLIPRRFAS